MKNPVSLLFTVFVIFPVSASAVTIVNFDGTANLRGATNANIDLGNFTSVANVSYGGGGSADRRGTRTGLATPMLAASSEYTGPDVYGGYESILLDVTSGNVLASKALVETTTQSTLRVAFNRASTGTGAAASGMFFFAASGSFDALSSLSMTTGSVGGSLAVRWLVRDGSTYYLSANTFASTADTTTTLSNPNSVLWQVYSPTADLVNFDQSVAAASHTFTDITAAGIYFEDDAIPTGSGLYTTMDLLKFSMDAVPEPSAGILALVGAGLGLGRRRRA